MKSFEQMRADSRSRKLRTRKSIERKKASPLGHVYVPEGPPDGIKKWIEDKHERWKVLVTAAWEGIREVVLERCHGKCESCATDITDETMHLHHWRGRGGGRRCDCPQHLQALCVLCHALAHKKRLTEPFVAATRGEGEVDAR